MMKKELLASLLISFLMFGIIWVKLMSPEGPVFADIPNRSGKGGKDFRMYKIRNVQERNKGRKSDSIGFFTERISLRFKTNAQKDSYSASFR